MSIFDTVKKKIKNVSLLILKILNDEFDYKLLKKIANIFFFIAEKIILNLDYFLDFYLHYYEDIIDSEIKLASISESSNVVHVGCGSVPASSILIAKKTGAKVTGIDKDESSVENARICIDKLNLADKIQIINTEAANFSFDCFDIIIVTHGIEPIKDFLEHLSKQSPKDSTIILRSFSPYGQELAESDKIVKKLFKMGKVIRYKNHGKVISIKLSVKK